jgi:subtilisin family serine protease
MKQLSLLVSFFVVALLLSPVTTQAGNILRSPRHVAGEYNVALLDDADVNAVAARFVNARGARIKSIGSAIMKSITVIGSDAMAQSIADDPQVRYVAENATMNITSVQSPAPNVGLDRIDQALLPLNNSYTYLYTGQNVVVYVVDTGVNPIGELGGRIIRQINFAYENGVRDPNNYSDCIQYGHGTEVSEIIGGSVYGVAKNVKFVNVRVFDCSGNGSVNDYVDALNWIVTDHANHPSETLVLVNFSGITTPANQFMDDATMGLLNQGVETIVAAGNSASDACNSSPARLGNPYSYPNNPHLYSTITVSGVRDDDSFNPGLNYGTCVDILAPSYNLIVLDKNGSPIFFGQTSAATPFVTGVAALRLEQFGALSPSAIEGSIKDNSTPNVITGLSNGTPNLLLYSLTIKHRICC